MSINLVKIYIMFFRIQPIKKRLIWGSNKLTEKFNLNENNIGEYWLIGSDNLIDKDLNISLDNFAVNNSDFLYGKNNKFPRFPVLIKYISTADWLSIQVHPDNEYARLVDKEPWGKTEVWYFLETTDRSKIIHGFKCNIKKDEIRNLLNKDIENYLNYVNVNNNDWILINPGTVHAIGPDNTILEIQMNSDITYRLYDWNRVDFNGNKRKLDIDKAIDVINADNNVIIKGFNDIDINIESFQVKSLNINNRMKFDTKKKTFHIIIPIKGDIIFNEKDIIKENSCILIPAEQGEYNIESDMDNKCFLIYLKEGELQCQV